MPATKVDIFCRVIDNFGDAGVCWRLARQLVFEHGLKVRLIIDRPEVLGSMVPMLARALIRHKGRTPELGYWAEGVRIFPWKTRAEKLSGPASRLTPAELVIAAFACDLPESYLDQMQTRKRFQQGSALPPRWLNLEYLSCESWAAASHGLSSPKPNRNLVEHFYFPGLASNTGGLLRERHLLAKRHAFAQDAAAQARLVEHLGLPSDLADNSNPVRKRTRLVFCFCYPHAPFAKLLEEAENWLKMPAAAEQGIERLLFLLPEGMALHEAAQTAQPGQSKVRVCRVPRLPQARFDELLWFCDLNLVRGEDSFCRALWAGKPMLWHIYPQAEKAHEAKLEAFLQYQADSAHALQMAWNALSPWPQGVFGDFLNHFAELQRTAEQLADRLGEEDDLANKLLRFCHLTTAKTPKNA